MRTTLALLGCVGAFGVGAVAGNDQPVVGVLAVPIGEECITAWRASVSSDGSTSSISADMSQAPTATIPEVVSSDHLGSCFHSLYVQWLESAGARAVPIPFDIPRAELDHLLESLNGVLFTGGEVELHNLTSGYMNAARHIVEHSVRLSEEEEGETFPIWGTCMGFQTLVVLAANNASILSEGAFDSESLSLPLDLTETGRTSRFWTSLRGYVQDSLEHRNVTCNLHHDGVFVHDFEAAASVTNAYNLVSTNKDRRGRLFASTIEHRTAPIFATQWHPERPQFQFSASAGEAGGINHDFEAVEAMQAVASFFVEQTRRSTHCFANQTELAQRLLYNDVPHGPLGDSYRAYIFPPSQSRPRGY